MNLPGTSGSLFSSITRVAPRACLESLFRRYARLILVYKPFRTRQRSCGYASSFFTIFDLDLNALAGYRDFKQALQNARWLTEVGHIFALCEYRVLLSIFRFRPSRTTIVEYVPEARNCRRLIRLRPGACSIILYRVSDQSLSRKLRLLRRRSRSYDDKT